VFPVDGDRFAQIGVIPTGLGTLRIYPSRDGKVLRRNGGSHSVPGPPRGSGSLAVIDIASRKVETTWSIPGGRSPGMGNVSADGRRLWLSGGFDDVVYAIDTASGRVTNLPVGKEPHGLAVWPQPGCYPLGHTGNRR
jgi:DNA-binding beta-propeller fold protein YncE